ncbi:hypothetical protein D3C80_307270 [compost metagenome]
MRRDLPELAGQRLDTLLREPVGTGAENDVQCHDLTGCRRFEGRNFVDRYAGEAGRLTLERKDGASTHRFGTDNSQRVGCETAEYRLDIKAAAYRKITAHALRRLAESHDIAGFEGYRAIGLCREAALRRIDGDGAGRTGNADDSAACAPEGKTAERQFKARRINRIADDAVCGVERTAIQGAGSRYTLPGLAEAAEILKDGGHGCGEHLEMWAVLCRFFLRTTRCRDGNIDRLAGLVHVEETHPVTRLEKCAGIAVNIPHFHRRRADDLPAAGAVLRIDAAEGTSQCH